MAATTYNSLMISSARCEMGAALLAISPELPVHIGINDAATVTEGSKIIKHLKGRAETTLNNEDGILRLGGTTSPLQAETPYRRMWAITNNGDLLRSLFNHIYAKGWEMVRISKVQAHITEEMVEKEEYTKEEKEGNDGGDEAADIGSCGLQPEEATLASFYARRHWRYHKLTAKIQISTF